MVNLVQGIFQGLPVKAPHSPVALPFHLDEQAGTGCWAQTHVHQCVMLVRRPLSHPGGPSEGMTVAKPLVLLNCPYSSHLQSDEGQKEACLSILLRPENGERKD